MLLRRFFSALSLVIVFSAGVLIGPHFVVRAEEDVPCVVGGGDETAPVTPSTTPPPAFFINELLPDPIGKDADGEFIEMVNSGVSAGALDGWQIEDGKGKHFALPSLVVSPGAFVIFLFADSGITLTNSGGSLLLRDPSGAVVQQVTYPALKEGFAFMRGTDGVFVETSTATSGAVNVQTAPVPPTTTSTPAIPSTPTTTTSSETTATTPVSTPANVFPSTPIISEFLPDPDGSDDAEWIELFNPLSTAISLDGWILDDAEGGSTAHTIALGTSIAPGQHMVFPRSLTKLALNNDTDSVRLFDPNEVLRDSVVYSQAQTGKAYARNGDEWSWTVPTPGTATQSAVVVIQPSLETSSVGSGSVSTDDSSAISDDDILVEDLPEEVSLDDLVDVPDGTEIITSGVITVKPGVLGKTLAVIQDTDFPVAVTVRLPSQVLTKVVAGSRVTLSGTVQQLHSGTRISVRKADFFRVDGHAEISPIDSDAVAHESVGPVLMRTQGVVSGVRGTTLSVTDADDVEWKVRWASGVKSGLGTMSKKGDEVSVVGILQSTDGTPSLLLTTKDAVTLIPKVELPVAKNQNEPREIPVNNAQSSLPHVPIRGILLATAAVFVVTFSVLQRRRNVTAQPQESMVMQKAGTIPLPFLPFRAIDKSTPPSYDIGTN